MKPNFLTQVLTALGITFTAIALGAESSLAQDRFSCDSSQVSTVVNTERGSVPLIRWTDRSFPPPFSPEQRCEIVSQRFKKFDNNGTLKYIKADEIDNMPVLCIAAYKGGSCLPDGLLVTFKPGTNANEALVKILDRRVWAAGNPLKFNSEGGNNSETVVSQVNGETYVDLELFLDWTE